MTTFDQGSNYTTIIENEERGITLSCFEDGKGYLSYEEAMFRAGIGASLEEFEKFCENCLKLIRKFKQ